MPELTECLRCRGRMERGLILDRGESNMANEQKWIEGTPERRWWGAIKTSGRESFPVRTFRCERCGWLESYANEE
jgi:hypothetical protein